MMRKILRIWGQILFKRKGMMEEPLSKGPTTRAATRRIQDEWDSTDINRVKLLLTWTNLPSCT